MLATLKTISMPSSDDVDDDDDDDEDDYYFLFSRYIKC